jgi:DhnA family fructose-bisphosphate aldolase class Ia
MNLGKLVRLNRLFAHPSGRFCSVAVDHYIGYGDGLPGGLRHIKQTLAAIMAAKPDALTMHKGIAASLWPPYAGVVPFILQAIIGRPDDRVTEMVATAEEAIRLGADAVAAAAFLSGATEGPHLRLVTDCVRDAARYDLPVICHAYPRDFTGKVPKVSFAPEDIAWAARCAVEAGADVVKVPYCGDVKAYAQIVADCPVPLVAAGGPQTKDLESALGMIAEVVQSGARGATIGRNIWGIPQITAAVHAFKAVIHDKKSPQEAMRIAGLQG